MDSVNAHAYSYAFHNRTITLMEEPLFTVDNIETMKLVMGGEPLLLNPKNVEPFIGYNDGFIIMTCNDLPWRMFPSKPFTNRSHVFHLTEIFPFSEFVTHDQFWTAYGTWSTLMQSQRLECQQSEEE